MSTRTHRLPAARLGVALLLVTTVLACTTTVTGTPGSTDSVVVGGDGEDGGVDPSFINGTDGSDIDRLAATVLTDVERYWEQTYPDTFGSEWEELSGGYYSVDTADANATPPPCVDDVQTVEGNAFYCPPEDVLAWDRAALLPVLRERFGDVSVMVVLAHEMGHAVQRRAGITTTEQQQSPERYPTILIEAQADCYAGSFVRWVADGHADRLRIATDQLDKALESLIVFRDPIGTEQTDDGAHGDAFDRVSAFQDGYDSGVGLCAEMSVDNRTFTQRGFLDAGDAQRGGNLPFDQLMNSINPDLDEFFGSLVTDRDGQWSDPEVRTSGDTPECAPADQGPIAYCPESDEIDVATGAELPELHADIGDYATGTILASRFGMAALSALDQPVEGEQAQHGTLCLAGAYTGMLLSRSEGFTLSPGDLDEAIQVLLHFDYAGRDAAGTAVPTGFDRVSLFREGTLNGPDACEL